MDIVDFCIQWEQGDLIVNNENELNQILDYCQTLAQSQGKYQRLYDNLKTFQAQGVIKYPFTI